MFLNTLLHRVVPTSWRRTPHRRTPAARRASWRPGVEALEDRTLPSVAAPELVKDINLVTLSSSPGQLVNVNGTAFFTADDGVHGRELWKSDGTPEGIVLVKDIGPGSTGSVPGNLTAVGGTLFFTVNLPGVGVELWTSDGTEASTVLVKDIVPGSEGSSPTLLTDVGGTLFFSAVGPGTGAELWRSD